MIRRISRLFVVALGVFAAACGAEPPPDRATSEQQIRQTVVSYNVMAVSGQAEQACAMLTEKARKVSRSLRSLGPNGTDDCVSYWTRMGQIPSIAEPMKATQVASVTVAGKHATATFTTGGTVNLIWSDGRWLLN